MIRRVNLELKTLDPFSIQEAACKHYVDNFFNDPNIIKIMEHINLNDRKITNARFIQFNQWPQIDSHLTAKLYVDIEIDQSSLVRNNQDNDFKKNNLTKINSITLNKKPEIDNQVITKAYVDQFHNDNERNRKDLGLSFYSEEVDLVKNNQNNNLNINKVLNINSITINTSPTDDNHISNRKYIDDELDKNTIVRFKQTLQNYLKVSVGIDIYHLTEYNEIQIIDITEIKNPNAGGYLLPYWKLICNDRNNSGKIQNFLKSTKTNSPTSDS